MKPAVPPLEAALSLSLLLLLLLLPSSTTAHNITRILAKHPEFSSFNQYLSLTHLAADINRRQTITVLALDNAAMSSLLSQNHSIYTIKHILGLHVLVDYYSSKSLHRLTKGTSLTASLFQATGSAPGSTGYVNITKLKGGKVGFGAEDNDGKLSALLVKSVREIPYNISIVQISQVLASVEAEAPTPAPSQLSVAGIMSEQGCKAFAGLLKASGADLTFQKNVDDGGVTAFCASNAVVSHFMPKYKNLTEAQKLSLLLYHGIPVYQSLEMLKSNNGVTKTLATDKANNYAFTVQNDGEDVTLETDIMTAKIMGTVRDEEPLMVFKISKVLLPKELFDAEEEVAPKENSDDQTAAVKSGAVVIDDGRLMITAVLGLCLWTWLM